MYGKQKLEKEKIYSLPIKNGHLDIRVCSDPDYPGLDVEYISDKEYEIPPEERDKTRPRVLIEVNEGVLRALIWSDTTNEDYSESIEFTCLEDQKMKSRNKILTIKDFNKGDKAYIVSDRYSRGGMRITEVTVATAGRQYVTVGENAWSRKFQNWDSDMLLEKVNCGASSYLFKTRKEAEEYIEYADLCVWLNTLDNHSKKYSLEQLRKVKEILG